ncbi:hypothetical protein [Granulicella arctica]|uniref:DUF1579 domain-containing protein n=1 Tax=Granulicella arctica TaxID=940613 RepID=A0A7Y9PK75_9BACT|nr:hypothetical protein [Granulicella arctica]NYF81255.1 hypothetical protein [Granulicella arctica]
MRVSFCTLLLFALLAALPSTAQTSPTLPAVPAGNFHFDGTWDCTGTFLRSGKTHKATFTGTPILGSTWLELTEQDIEPATGYLAKYLIGYDSQQKRLVEFDANNFGAAMYSSTDGWKNDVLTMTSPVADTPNSYAANRFLYTITSPKTFTVDWQISKTSTLVWVPSDHLECTLRSTTIR